MQYIRYTLLALLMLLVGYFSYRTYLYFFNEVAPEINCISIAEGQCCAGDVDLTLRGSSPYKVAHMSVWLDGQLLNKDIKLQKKSFDYPITLRAQELDNGSHILNVEVIDGSRNKNKTLFQRKFSSDNLGLQATLTSTSLDHKALQGRCIHVQFQVNKPMIKATAKALSGQYPCFPKNKNALVYETFIPLECDQVAGEYPFTIDIKDGVGNKILLEDKFQVMPATFQRKILHVPGNKLKTELEFTSLQEHDLEQAIEKITKNSVQEKLWSGAFDVPILTTGTVTEFGVIRTSQDRGRTVHKALDLVAVPKSVIWAAANGIVVLKDRFTHSGNTVIIDHGYGLISMYFHLHDFADNLTVGQKVKRGNPLGRMGMTGFANGQHLHWEIRVNNVAVDPMQFAQLVG